MPRVSTILLVALLTAHVLPVSAQQQSPIPQGYHFDQIATTTLAASTTSAQASVGAYPMVLITNTSNAVACIAWGANPVAIYPCQGNFLSPGQSGIFLTLSAAKIAAVLSTGSATLQVYEGYIIPG